MTRRRARLALVVVAVVALLAGVLLSLAQSAPSAHPESPPPPERPPAQRPELMLLTSLPIVFPERLTLDTAGSPALEALQSRYRVVPISVTTAGELGKRRLLLMAQPQAQPAEALVELDAWVRGGGRVLLLADPVLEWPSERPPGDLLRPPTAFADTGLLGHWGLRLEPPDERGPASSRVGGRKVRTVSAGTLVASGPACATAGEGLVARCTLGRGEVVVVADSDFLNLDAIEGAADEANIGMLLDELARIEQ